jgi:hypothetical protein
MASSRRFSRWMPPLSPHPSTSILAWIVSAALAAIIVTAVITNPIVAGIVASFFLLPRILANRSADREEHRLLDDRKGEDIGTFARAFDRGSEPFDPWVVQATWDALRSCVNIPLRPTDRVGDLGIDPDEFDLALFWEVAERSGHSMDNLEANPYFSNLSSFSQATVGDIVRIISYQPKETGCVSS